MNSISKESLYCGVKFEALLTELKRGNAKFCKLKCFHDYRKSLPKRPKKANVKCAFCGISFWKRPCAIKTSKNKIFFCCREHKDKAQRIEYGLIEIHPPHYNNNNVTYRKKAFRNYDKCCARCGYNEHTFILEVHHVNKDRSDNDLENLEILCPNCHALEHRGIGNGRT